MLLQLPLAKWGRDGSQLSVWIDPKAVLSLRQGVKRTAEGWWPVVKISLCDETSFVVDDPDRDVVQRVMDAMPEEGRDEGAEG